MHNQVANALSRKQVDVVVAKLSRVEIDFLDRIRVGRPCEGRCCASVLVGG